MSKKNKKHIELKIKKENTSQNTDYSTKRNIIGGVFLAFGAIPYAYTTFYEHNLSVWLTFIGSIFIVIGVFLFAYSHFKRIYLIFLSICILTILFFCSYSLQNVYSNDNITIKKDNRAWININTFNFIDVELGKMPTINFTIINTGNIPASILPCGVLVKIGTGIYGEDFNNLQIQNNVFVLAPDQVSTPQQAKLIKELNEEDIKDLTSKKRAIYASLLVIYSYGSGNKNDTTLFSATYDYKNKSTHTYGDKLLNYAH